MRTTNKTFQEILEDKLTAQKRNDHESSTNRAKTPSENPNFFDFSSYFELNFKFQTIKPTPKSSEYRSGAVSSQAKLNFWLTKCKNQSQIVALRFFYEFHEPISIHELSLKKAFRRLALRFHPDRHTGSTANHWAEKFIELQQHFEVLKKLAKDI